MGSEISTRLGARIRALRKAKGWRLVDLAEHSGVREVGLNALVAIAQGLEVSLSELLKGIEDGLNGR